MKKKTQDALIEMAINVNYISLLCRRKKRPGERH